MFGSTAQQQIILDIETRGVGALQDLEARQQLVNAQIDAFRIQLDQGVISSAEFRKATQRLIVEEQTLTKELAYGNSILKDTVAAQGRLDASLERVATRADVAKTKMAGLGSAAQATGYFFQDLAQGGGAAVINNLDRLGTGFSKLAGLSTGAGAAIGGMLTLAGTAALFAVPPMLSFFKSLIDGSNAVPKAADDLKGLESQLKANGTALDRLREKQSLTNSELLEFNKLTAEGVRLEKEVAEAKERQAAADKLKQVKPDDDKVRAESLQKSLKDDPRGEGGRGLISAMMMSYDEQARKIQQADVAERASIQQAMYDHKDGAYSDANIQREMQLTRQIEAMAKRIEQGPTTWRGAAEQTVAAAVGGGDIKAFREIEQTAKEHLELLNAQEHEALRMASPEQMKLEEEGRVQGVEEAAKHKRAEEQQKKDKELEAIRE